LAFRNAAATFGERADSSITVSSTYRQAVVADTSKPAQTRQFLPYQ
jgi:hypothetical protein